MKEKKSFLKGYKTISSLLIMLLAVVVNEGWIVDLQALNNQFISLLPLIIEFFAAAGILYGRIRADGPIFGKGE